MTDLGHLVVVRQARLEDLDALVGFSLAMALETEQRALDASRLRMGTQAVLRDKDRGVFYVAETDGGGAKAIIGQLLVTYEWSDWRNAQFWWIQSVYVAPPWRRQGVYRRMHETIVTEARNRGDVCGIRLYVEKDNSVAQTVYRRVGLQPSCYQVFEEDFVLPGRKGTD